MKKYRVEHGVGIIPEGTTEIGIMAFDEPKAMTSIVIPASVKDISCESFVACTNLSSIVVAEENEVYDSRDRCNAIMETATNTLIFGVKTTKIPATTEYIGDWAFYCNWDIIDMVIPEGVKSIGSWTFKYCINIPKITIPGSVVEICESAFHGCRSLRNVVLREGVKKIGAYAFSRCENLERVQLPVGVSDIDMSAFKECDQLKEISVPYLQTVYYMERMPEELHSLFVERGESSQEMLEPPSLSSLGCENHV